MFKKKLSIDKYLLLYALCILVNLLESWYFGFNLHAESTAEYICDYINAIPIAIITVWLLFTCDDLLEFLKAQLASMFIMISYYVMYYLILAQ